MDVLFTLAQLAHRLGLYTIEDYLLLAATITALVMLYIATTEFKAWGKFRYY